MSSSSSYAPCAACKYLRRKCTQECVFAPYFPPDNPQKFINVHKVFGASNVGKILNELNPSQRNEAVNSLAYEADCRIKDPIYGCVGYVSILQHHLRQLQQEVDRAKKELATYIGPAAMQPILTTPPHLLHLQQQQHHQSFDPSLYNNNNNQINMAPQQYNNHQEGQQQLLIQEAPQQEIMLRAYAQQQEQLYAQQQEQLYAQRMYVQQQQQQQQQEFNDGFVQIAEEEGQPALALGGSFETHYQTQQQQQQQQQPNSHHQHQFQIQELLLQSPQHHQFGANNQRDASQEVEVDDEEGEEEEEEERSFGPL